MMVFLILFGYNQSSSEIVHMSFFCVSYKKLSTALVIIKQKIYCFYISCILFVRSFFLKERPGFILFINLFYPTITLIIPTNLEFNAFVHMRLLMIIGVYLIMIDYQGSVISKKILSSEKDSYLNKFLENRYNNTIKGAFVRAGLSALFMGKTPMTATGRATMIGAVFSGGVFLYNEHLKRNHDKQQASAHHAHEQQQASAHHIHEQQQAEQQRAYSNYTYARDQYDKSWFKKGPRPVWSEKDSSSWKDTNQTNTGSNSTK